MTETPHHPVIEGILLMATGSVAASEIAESLGIAPADVETCLLYTSPSPRDRG